jgi:Ser-tRNA(Ala) deacylase AlaX
MHSMRWYTARIVTAQLYASNGYLSEPDATVAELGEGGAPVTGGQLYTDRARMDFALEDLSPERLRQIEEVANARIAKTENRGKINRRLEIVLE